jgi:hypothetical protein
VCSGNDGNNHDPRAMKTGNSARPGRAEGRGNGHNEPNQPWWGQAMTRRRWRAVAAVIVAFGGVFAAACMTPPDDDDRPGQTDISTPSDCAELDTTAPIDCE